MSAPDTGNALQLRLVPTLAEVDPAAWNALCDPNHPFLDHEFLYTFEVAGRVGAHTSWQPRYALLHEGEDLVAAAPVYIKLDSQGEFVWDWNWAEAYQRAGLSYYPKAIVAAPFTPASGQRLLVAPERNRAAIARALIAAIRHALAPEVSSLHVLFCSAEEREWLTDLEFLPRENHQYHWHNRGYRDFQDFLDEFRSKKRRQIERERATIRTHGLHIEALTGAALGAEHAAAMWSFYADTHVKHGSPPHLNRRWFTAVLETMADRLLVVMARAGVRPVGATWNFLKGDTLYGRYWGGAAGYDALHFECCYYQLIEYAIAHGLRRVEAGAQGEHKFFRGFTATPTYSAHWIADPAGRAAISRYLEAERRQARAIVAAYNEHSPLKRIRAAGGDSGGSDAI